MRSQSPEFMNGSGGESATATRRSSPFAAPFSNCCSSTRARTTMPSQARSVREASGGWTLADRQRPAPWPTRATCSTWRARPAPDGPLCPCSRQPRSLRMNGASEVLTCEQRTGAANEDMDGRSFLARLRRVRGVAGRSRHRAAGGHPHRGEVRPSSALPCRRAGAKPAGPRGVPAPAPPGRLAARGSGLAERCLAE